MNGYGGPNIGVNGAAMPVPSRQPSLAQQPAFLPMTNAIQGTIAANAEAQVPFPSPFVSMPPPALANPALAQQQQQQQQLQQQQMQQQMLGMRARPQGSQSGPAAGIGRGGPPRPITAPTDGGPPYRVPLHPVYTRMTYTEPGELFPSLSSAEQLRVKAWMDRDLAYEQALVASRMATRQEQMTLLQDWIKREDWLGQPDQPVPPRFSIRFQADRMKEQAKGKRGGIRQPLKLSKQLAATAAAQDENLIPIRIDCENEAYKIRETFTWNLNETAITPEMFASHMIEDLRVPYAPFFREIVAQIRRHIEDARLTDSYTTHLDSQYHEARERNRRWFVERASAPDAVLDAQGGDSPEDPAAALVASVEAADGPDRELRIVIKLDITQDNVQIVDKFEWDVSDSLNSPEEFAEIYAADLGLTGEFKTAIAHSIREQLDVYVRSLCIIGYVPGTFITDEELRSEFLAHVAEPVREDPSEFTPLINYLTPEELERNDREREREVRRKRRQTKGRGATLPERDRPKTHRTAVPKPSNEPIQPYQDARGDMVWPQPEIVYAYPIQTNALVPKPGGLSSPAESPLRLAKPIVSQSLFDGVSLHRGPGRPSKRFRADGLYGDSASGIVSPSDGTPVGTPGPDGAFGRTSKRRGPRYENTGDGTWHCINCGVPDYLSTGRRKGPSGPNTLCGMCGKYYNRYKRNRPVDYTTDPEHHRKVKAEYEAAAAVAGVEQSANARLEEEHQRARATGTMRPKRVIPDSSDDSDDSQDSSVPLAHRKARGQSPDLPFVDVGSDSESSASASQPPTPRRPSAAPPQRPPPTAARPPPPPPPEPLPWMKQAAAGLKAKQVDDRFEIIPRPRAPDSTAALEWRIRCLDCPGKLYNLGPGETLDNFAIHFRNKQHRANVEARLGRGKPAGDVAAPSSSSAVAGGGGSAAGAGSG
ncbi:hypothetical protein ACM66B_000705 [Microbotryomycetes sp. NB124-2]